MISISKSYSFDSSHQLYRVELTEEQNHYLFGKCARLHGHTYLLDVTIEGEIDEVTGMILNYFELDKIVKPIVDRLDHQHLNEIFDGLTTSELMVGRIAVLIEDEIEARGHEDIRLSTVALQETPKTSAVWYADN